MEPLLTSTEEGQFGEVKVRPLSVPASRGSSCKGEEEKENQDGAKVKKEVRQQLVKAGFITGARRLSHISIPSDLCSLWCLI